MAEAEIHIARLYNHIYRYHCREADEWNRMLINSQYSLISFRAGCKASILNRNISENIRQWRNRKTIFVRCPAHDGRRFISGRVA